MMENFYLLVDFSLILLIINVLVSLKIFKLRPELKWFELYLFVGLIIQVWMRYLAGYVINNLFLTHFYTGLEFILLSLFYREIFGQNTLFNLYFKPFVLVIVAAIIANTIFLQPLDTFCGNSKTLAQIILISYAIFWFFKRLDGEVKTNHLLINRINASILLYYAGSLLIFMSDSYMKRMTDIDTIYLWIFNVVIYIAFLLLVLFARVSLLFYRKGEN